MKQKPPGHCVECFKPLNGDNSICNGCQSELDGEFDHLKQVENVNNCYKCDAEIDEDDTVCCNCIDDTGGRNQHFWQIKDEIPPKSEWKNISLKIGEHLGKAIKKEKN